MKGKVIAAAFALTLGLILLALIIRTVPVSPLDASPSAAQPAASRAPSAHSAALLAPPPPKTESAVQPPAATNLYARLADGDIPKVSREQLEPFLEQHHRSLAALLGALRASGDEALLTEAKEKFPNDPRVQFAAAFATESPEERGQWLEKFQQSDPGNALADYLLAGEHFKAGRIEQALQEIEAAAVKPALENYLLDFIQNAEEAYVGAGVSGDNAKAIAATSALLPEQAHLKKMGMDLVDLAKRYQQAGDETSAESLLELGASFGRRLGQAPQTTLIQELVGIAIERVALSAMKPEAPFGDTGQTVRDQLDALSARRQAYQELTSKSDPIMRNMSDQELAHYFDRVKLFGDAAALRWVINKGP